MPPGMWHIAWYCADNRAWRGAKLTGMRKQAAGDPHACRMGCWGDAGCADDGERRRRRVIHHQQTLSPRKRRGADACAISTSCDVCWMYGVVMRVSWRGSLPQLKCSMGGGHSPFRNGALTGHKPDHERCALLHRVATSFTCIGGLACVCSPVAAMSLGLVGAAR